MAKKDGKDSGHYRTVKFALYPNAAQKKQIERNIVVQRYVYNATVYVIRYMLRVDNRFPSQFELNTICTKLWQRNEWMHEGVYQNSLNEIAARALRNSKRDVSKGQDIRYKKWGRMRSFTYAVTKSIGVFDIVDANNKKKRYVKLGKFKEPIRARNMTDIPGIPVTITVGHDNNVRPGYWCTVQCRDVPYHGSTIVDQMSDAESSEAVGVDLGLTHTAYLSDGTYYENDHQYQKKKDKFAKMHRKYSKHMYDEDADKQLAKLQHAYTKLTNERKNRLHEISHHIAENYETIVMEDLSVKQLRSISLSRRMMNSYNDASLGGLIRMICYKRFR